MKKYIGILAFIALGLLSSFYDYNNQETSTFKKWDNTVQRTFVSKYVVILVIDGPRYSETFGDSSYQYIPYMGKYLAKEGTLFTNFRNNGITHTANGHTAITTGVYQKIKNNGSELPKNPNIFQYYLKEKNVDKKNAFLISSKGKLEVLSNTTHKKWFNTFQPMTYCGINGDGNSYAGDAMTWKKVEEVFNNTNRVPNLTLINLLGVDINGHNNNWKGYLNHLKNCDEYAYKLWNIIQQNPITKDQTTLLITNDHGRHLDGRKDGFISHGDGCEGCRHVSLLAIGPDIKKNNIVTQKGELIDISKTIGTLLNFSVPTSKGRVLEEMFR